MGPALYQTLWKVKQDLSLSSKGLRSSQRHQGSSHVPATSATITTRGHLQILKDLSYRLAPAQLAVLAAILYYLFVKKYLLRKWNKHARSRTTGANFDFCFLLFLRQSLWFFPTPWFSKPAAFPRNKLAPDLEEWWKCLGGNSPSKVNVYYKSAPILLET